MIAKVNALTKEITFTSGPYPSATGDDTVQRLNFVMDRYSGNGTDLGSGDIYIYYTNGRGVTYAHPVTKFTKSSDGLYINFTWDFAREVAEYHSPTKFSVCSKIIDGDVITNEWNSEIATLPIIKSIGHREASASPGTYEAFEALFHQMENVAASVEDTSNVAKGYSELAEAWARGTMSGTDVGPEDFGYEDNAKYYLEQTKLIAPESIPNSDIDEIVEGSSEEEETVDG